MKTVEFTPEEHKAAQWALMSRIGMLNDVIATLTKIEAPAGSLLADRNAALSALKRMEAAK